jgi:hypothetical protein
MHCPETIIERAINLYASTLSHAGVMSALLGL